MGLITVLSVLFQSSLLLESFHGSFRFAAVLAVYLKGSTQLVQELLQGFDICAGRAVLQQPAAQRVSEEDVIKAAAEISTLLAKNQSLLPEDGDDDEWEEVDFGGKDEDDFIY